MQCQRCGKNLGEYLCSKCGKIVCANCKTQIDGKIICLDDYHSEVPYEGQLKPIKTKKRGSGVLKSLSITLLIVLIGILGIFFYVNYLISTFPIPEGLPFISDLLKTYQDFGQLLIIAVGFFFVIITIAFFVTRK